MSYIPNLIPDESKVLLNYFNESKSSSTKKNIPKGILHWILGVLFFILSLGFILHPIVFLLFGCLGFMMIPPGHRYVEKKLRFKLTPRIKTITASVLFFVTMPIAGHFSTIDGIESEKQRKYDEKVELEKSIADQKEQDRIDSLNFYIQQSNQLRKDHKLDGANEKLQYAMSFASSNSDNEKIELGKQLLSTIKTQDLVESGKYSLALTELNKLLKSDPDNLELLYSRAICYSKTGKIQAAVNDLLPLVGVGNIEAKELYNKINPLKKRVSGYITRCRDGSTSNARGRGACSRHGGVANWNEPVYEEYRKY